MRDIAATLAFLSSFTLFTVAGQLLFRLDWGGFYPDRITAEICVGLALGSSALFVDIVR